MPDTLDTYLNGHKHPHKYSHALIPSGVADHFWDAAAKRRQLEQDLLTLFQSWGYGYIIPPTLEYADTFDVGYSTLANPMQANQARTNRAANMIRFLDHDGQPLALRYDMTIGIARLVGTRLHDAPMPQRFCYASNVFRTNEHQPGRLREFGQVGIELVGASTTAADVEPLVLTARALQSAGLSNFRLAVGQLNFFRGILDELNLSPIQEQQLTQAVERRSEPELHSFLEQAALKPTHQTTVQRLLRLNGANSQQTLDDAMSICLNQTMENAVTNLRAIYHALDAYQLSQYIHFDLTEVSDMGYYTGIRFTAYAPGVGGGIAGGGRYDNLIEKFGPAQPAVGMGLGMERILVALESQQNAMPSAAKPALENHVLVSNDNDPEWVKTIEAWRSAGIRVVVDVDNWRGVDLWNAAQDKGIPVALDWVGNGFAVYDTDHINAEPTDSQNADSQNAAPVQARTIPIEECQSYLPNLLKQQKDSL